VNRPRLLSLFSGIGGFELGLERAGFVTVAQCEIDPFCRRVLAKHWPHVKRYDDVRTLTADRLRADGITVDAACGGFPCQDISSAGDKVGIDGERSGLWAEYARIIGEIRPRVVVVENVADLLHRGLDRVLGDLAALGYDAEWHCIPASHVGAAHRRDRLWIVASPHDEGEPTHAEHDEARRVPATGAAANAYSLAPVGSAIARQELHPWPDEPGLARVVHGLSDQVERRTALGNAVVPQIPELIGRAILAAWPLSQTAHRTTAPLIERLPPNTSEAA
jgi:DNA (cytosine-5)-methyltransferase 1